MWVVSDEAMEQILGGNFIDVAVLHEECNKITVRKLYKHQNVYKSYQGFRKFFRKHLEPIIEKVCFIEDNRIIGKIIKYFSGV